MTELLPDIHWTGITDWSIRVFQGYETEQGTSYNSFLIQDQQPALIDTVPERFFQDYIDKLTALTQLDQIKFIVMLHVEPDHSGVLPRLYPYLSTCTIVCTAAAKNMLCKLYPTLTHARYQVVSQSSELNLGFNTLKFMPCPMLHWPEQQYCLIKESRVLFSSDSFGQHMACSERWAEDLLESQVLFLQRQYLANVLAPFQAPIGKALQYVDQIKPLAILPAHGVGFKNVARFTQLYRDYALNQHLKKKIVIMFDTMHNGTFQIAQQLAEGVRSAGFNVLVLDVKVTPLSRLASETMESCGVLVGSATFNNIPMSNVFKAINYLRGLSLLKDKPAKSFYCYGWNRTAVGELLNSLLEQGHADLLSKEPWAANFRPKEGEFFEKGVWFAQHIQWIDV